ncbi:MAG: hypothetical protein J6M54_02725 [Prevotella sp.]|nr:hypothetical protein [Prevotella sp.]
MSTTVNMVAQSFPDMALDKDFAAQIKSIDEFIQRFNGDESHPELKREDRIVNLLALFDYKMNHEGLSDSAFKKNVMDFVQQVNASGSKIKLTDDAFYAEAEITANISGKSLSLSIILQSQTYNKDRIRWAIVGVRGLAKAGIIDTEHFYGISPVDHETHFMSIGDIFAHNAPEIIGYRGKDTKIDELSVFLTMAKLDKVRIISVNQLTMHCLEIPDFVFTINEEGRRGGNSGWLISKVIKINENEKNKYKSKLLGR